MEKKDQRFFDLLVIALFLGILLTFAVFYLTNATIGGRKGQAEACYDGSVIEGNGADAAFLRAVYEDLSTLDFIREYEYRVFHVVNDDVALAGRDDFLFPVREESGYDYLEDYLGDASFDAAELAAITDTLKTREAALAEKGVSYLLVVIPNSQTVYNDLMPWYLGSGSRETRLTRLTDYLDANGFNSYLDLTDDLRAAKPDGQLYHNTENALNALGVYYTYRAVYERLSEDGLLDGSDTQLMRRADLNFYQHTAAGKTVAREAGIEDVAENRTVSLSSDTKPRYQFTFNTGKATRTVLVPPNYDGPINSPALLLQFSNTWERLQSEPFFSNTFGRVTYQASLDENEEIFALAAPAVVVQFVYESELPLLLTAEQKGE